MTLSSDYGTRISGSWTAGTPIPVYLVTKDFLFNDVSTQDRLQRVEIETVGAALTVGVSGVFDTVGGSFKQSTTLAAQSTWRRILYLPDVTGYQFRLYLSASGSVQVRLILLYALQLRFTNR